MPNVVKYLLLVVWVMMVSSSQTYLNAQKTVSNPQEIELEHNVRGQLQKEISSFRNIAKSIIGASLALSLIIVIYHVANDSKYGKGKQAVISWVVAVIIYTIASNINMVR